MNSDPLDCTHKDILIVDDTPINLRVLAKILSDRGYKVRKALNGQIALTACQTLLPDVILLDIMMPDMDGYEVCQRLKSDPKTQDIPVIFISALEDQWDKVKAFKSGGSDYITKPFQIEEVLARVKHHLTIQQLQYRLQVQNAELQALNAQLLRSNVELEQFAHVAAHDLQSPLQVIIGNADLLTWKYENQLGPDGDRYLTHIIKASGRMTQLIQDLLSYSKIGIPPQRFESIDSNFVLEEALANLSGEISKSGAIITHSHLPIVSGNEIQLMQLFQNMMANAIKFRLPNVAPQIEISCNLNDSEEWQFEIRDNGIGIDPNLSDRIFEAFYRLHSYDEYPGTGIGLTLCKKIVERHGGRLWFNSIKGEGTSFYFTLPALNS
ncbi:response regulator [Oscillatoria acuminata]|uniref:histidine kinase n=1 Tax=Oscillatoria acuminata PCC 6304 TaxID=56110 RepID=K9TLE0_9CYAN|nr:response regulator [Oscillatoria acuminata]AFY82971.1 bacteriophytochrome (light-regulated signal transduction histidine kinase) [Oscillatoria acuminata PCC 6304]